MKISTCTKCGGSGKVSFTTDGGICYKCEGVRSDRRNIG